jgi:hypothetical protein
MAEVSGGQASPSPFYPTIAKRGVRGGQIFVVEDESTNPSAYQGNLVAGTKNKLGRVISSVGSVSVSGRDIYVR